MKISKQTITKPKSLFLLSMVLFMLVGTSTTSYATTIIDFNIMPIDRFGQSFSGTFSLELDAGDIPISVTAAAISHSNSAGSFLFTVPPPPSSITPTLFRLLDGGSELIVTSFSATSGFPTLVPFSKSGGDINLVRVDPGQQGAIGISTTITPVPEPGTALLLSTGLLGLAGYRWQQRKRCVRKIG